MYRLFLFIIAVLITGCSGSMIHNPSPDFGAYYTHIVTNAGFEKYSRTGDYTDIIVDLGKENGQLVFWRGSSYLPYWESAKGKRIYIDEIIPRSGNGDKIMPDKVNSFSFVKIIENTENKVVVYWRYLPEFGSGNPLTSVKATRFVDEYFAISPDGTVQRTIKQGTPKYEDWADTTFQYTQTFNLSKKGISNKVLTQPVRSISAVKKSGRPLVSGSIAKPSAWFKFDKAYGDTAYESLSNSAMVVMGSNTYWRQGVSGTALQFDDVSTYLSLPAVHAPKPKTAITLEGWVAIGAYPWNWCPIVQQADDVPEELDLDNKAHHNKAIYKKEDDRGYFLGIDGHGHPGMKIRVGGNWEELTSDVHLERRTWYYITGTFDKNTGKIMIFINGEPAGEKKVAVNGDIELSSNNLQIGRGKERRQVDPVRVGITFPGYYSFDGLMDEIKIYDIALTAKMVKESFEMYGPEKLDSVDMPQRILPSGGNTGTFGATYSALKYFDTWDNLFRFTRGADVTVSFEDNPTKFVFWRGVSYIPMIVNEKNEWYSNEFNETWGKSGGKGCQEPMSDKGSYYSHVKIIENTPARVVVQWRFALLDVEHVLANYNDTTGWSDWSDWYYYIYPDGVASKKMQLWTDGERNHEWQESMVIFGPDQHPDNIVERSKTITMVSEDGKYTEYDWKNSPPENVDSPKNSNIQLINLTGDYDPFTIATKFVGKTRVFDGEMTPYASFCTWNHWPIAQMPSDGRYASYPDRTSHSSLSNVYLPVYKEEKNGNKPFYEKVMLEGMWNKEAIDLIPLSRSWTHAPVLINLTGATGKYNMEQRAYVLNVSADMISFTVNASEEKPIYNLCFVLKKWNSKKQAEINVPGNVRQGTVRDTDGSLTNIIFIETETNEPLSLNISR